MAYAAHAAAAPPMTAKTGASVRFGAAAAPTVEDVALPLAPLAVARAESIALEAEAISAAGGLPFICWQIWVAELVSLETSPLLQASRAQGPIDWIRFCVLLQRHLKSAGLHLMLSAADLRQLRAQRGRSLTSATRPVDVAPPEALVREADVAGVVVWAAATATKTETMRVRNCILSGEKMVSH